MIRVCPSPVYNVSPQICDQKPTAYTTFLTPSDLQRTVCTMSQQPDISRPIAADTYSLYNITTSPPLAYLQNLSLRLGSRISFLHCVLFYLHTFSLGSVFRLQSPGFDITLALHSLVSSHNHQPLPSSINKPTTSFLRSPAFCLPSVPGVRNSRRRRLSPRSPLLLNAPVAPLLSPFQFVIPTPSPHHPDHVVTSPNSALPLHHYRQRPRSSLSDNPLYPSNYLALPL